MLLIEVFNQHYKWKWKENNDKVVKAMFYTNDNTLYYFVAAIMNTDNDIPTWDVEFARMEEGKYNQINRYDITKTGDQYRILSTIIDITKQFIKEHNVVCMYLSAEEPSRMKLYKRMVKTLLSNWITQYDIGGIAVYHPSLQGKI